ncbi:MAG: hypothetical protein RI983_792 [Bacteroidota bacterium]|jgi:hypothetical protein
MKRYWLLFLPFLMAISCSKKTAPEVEENISFQLNTGAVITSAGSNQEFKVTLSSKMPKSGIKIDITAAEEATGIPVIPQSSAISSSSIVTDCLVQNLPRQKWVVTTVKVSSANTPSNNVTQTFKIVYK